MAEYIEKAAAVKVVLRERKPTNSVAQNRMLSIIQHDLLTMRAADVAPVVRCKGCKHKGWVQEPCHGKSVDYCRVWDCTLRNLESTFCSYGEPKGGEHA